MEPGRSPGCSARIQNINPNTGRSPGPAPQDVVTGLFSKIRAHHDITPIIGPWTGESDGGDQRSEVFQNHG